MQKTHIRIPESKQTNPKSKQAKASGSAAAETAEEDDLVSVEDSDDDTSHSESESESEEAAAAEEAGSQDTELEVPNEAVTGRSAADVLVSDPGDQVGRDEILRAASSTKIHQTVDAVKEDLDVDVVLKAASSSKIHQTVAAVDEHVNYDENDMNSMKIRSTRTSRMRIGPTPPKIQLLAKCKSAAMITIAFTSRLRTWQVKHRQLLYPFPKVLV